MKLKLESRFLSVFSISFIALILLTSYQNCSRTALQSNYSDQKNVTASNPSPSNAVRDVNTNCVLTQVSGPMIAVGAELYFQFTKQENQINPKYSCDNGTSWSVLNLQNSVNSFITGLSEGNYVCKARVENSNGSLTNCLGQLSVQVVGANVVIPPTSAPNPNPVPTQTPTPSPQPNPTGATSGLISLNDNAEMKRKKAEYVFITAGGLPKTNFKESYKPSNLTETIPGFFVLIIDDYNSRQQSTAKLKFFIPPGASKFWGRYLMFLTTDPGQGVWKMNQPSVVRAINVTLEMALSFENSNRGQYTDEVLQNIIDGKDQYFMGAPSAGLMPISSGSVIADRNYMGGYLYAEFAPLEARGATNYILHVKKSCYEKWWSNPNVWDENNNPKEGYKHSCE